jgi:predicted alpha/beta hydrolase family esterase
MATILKAERVEQADWNQPDPENWQDGLRGGLDRLQANHPGKAAVIVAHSLGCILAVRWVLANPEQARKALRGLLLVAPADVDSPDHTPNEVRTFAPIPTTELPVPALVVASTSDPYCPYGRAASLATAWGASLCNIGDAGHINVEAGFGPWPLGMALLRRLSSAP